MKNLALHIFWDAPPFRIALCAHCTVKEKREKEEQKWLRRHIRPSGPQLARHLRRKEEESRQKSNRDDECYREKKRNKKAETIA